MTFTESNLRFSFQKAWQIKKYDAHRYYQAISGRGFKGVDFLGILNDEYLVLFEVKNYTIRNAYQSIPDAQAIAERPAKLSETMVRKVDDTLYALQLIQQYYQRKWWYRHLFPFLRRWRSPDWDFTFWTRAFELSQQADRLIIVLWLESDFMAPSAYHTTQAKLEEALRGKVHRVVVSNCIMGEFLDYMHVERG